MEQVTGIEPAQPAWEAGTLPLSYTCKHHKTYYIIIFSNINTIILTTGSLTIIQFSQLDVKYRIYISLFGGNTLYKLSYEFSNNIPLFKSDFCGKCLHILESTSLIYIKNRGCCWYFPKYTLMDMKNILSCGRHSFLEKIKVMENCKVSQYFMNVTGYFDKTGFSNYIISNPNSTKYDFDETLFFKKCPFAGSKGCTIDYIERPHPCNLYLCREMIEYCKDTYKEYSLERKDYFSYCNYFNEVLKNELISNKTDLIKDFDKSINIIESTDVPNFSPRKLKEIYFITNIINSKVS